MPAPIAVIGRKGSGKTQVLSQLIAILTQQGYRVGVVKHLARSDMEIDQPEKDTYEFRMRGAEKVILSGPRRYAVFENRDHEVSLTEHLKSFAGYDAVFFVGYVVHGVPTIEIHRKGNGPFFENALINRIAVFTDEEPAECGPCEGLFVCRRVEMLADFVGLRLRVHQETEAS